MLRNVQPQPVTQADPTIVLDQNFAINAVEEMRKLGAKNVAPPLAPSTHLKNIKTGLIFPWTAALAEQRDILVNCDENGNTDPAVWRQTMLTEQDLPDQTDLMQQAYANLCKPEVRLPQCDGFMQAPPAQINATGQMPHGAQTLDKYLDSVNVTPESAQTLEQLSQIME